MASAIENARLYEATVDLAARLRAIQDLTARLNRIQDVRGIAEAIVTEARSLIDYDNIRVYRVDHDAGVCEPIAFQGVFMGVEAPTTEMLRCRIGEGLTGWVAEHNESIVIGDAETDDRGDPRRADRRTRVDAPRPDDLRRPGRGRDRRSPSSAGTGSPPTTRRPCRSSPAMPPRRSSTPTTPSACVASSASSSSSSPASAGSSRSTRRSSRRSTRTPSSR